jgi:hypothetical protein
MKLVIRKEMRNDLQHLLSQINSHISHTSRISFHSLLHFHHWIKYNRNLIPIRNQPFDWTKSTQMLRYRGFESSSDVSIGNIQCSSPSRSQFWKNTVSNPIGKRSGMKIRMKVGNECGNEDWNEVGYKEVGNECGNEDRINDSYEEVRNLDV